LLTAAVAAAQAGQLDPTFGKNGIAVTDFGVQYQQDIAAVGGVAIQTDGKIVVAGGVPANNGKEFPSFAVARYRTNGSLDTSFRVGGIVIILSLYGNFTAVAIQPDGKIVAGGGADVVRFNSDGSLDSTFGTGGILSFGEPFAVSAIALQTNGTIAVTACNQLFLLSSNGQGKDATLPFSTASSVAALSNGKFLVGTATPSFVFRYTSSGQLDTAFAINGQQLHKARMKMRGLLFPKRRVLRRDLQIVRPGTPCPDNSSDLPQLSLSYGPQRGHRMRGPEESGLSS
jgi:uncharacterized delta-60 repeat protein